MDESTKEGRLDFILPQHEFFHQYFVLADCENQLFREKSRGLPGGSFLLATILNRKDVKSKKGKDAIEAFKEFFLLKSDAMFNNYFIYKYQLDDLVDNSPPLLKHSSSEVKAKYLYDLVSEALKDLLPHFKSAEMDLCELDDFPLTEGRIVDKPAPLPAPAVPAPMAAPAVPAPELAPPPARPAMVLDSPNAIDKAMVEATVTQLQTPIDIDDMIQKHMLKCSSSVSSSRTRNEFSCKLCSYKTKYESICVSHVANCLKKLCLSPEASLDPAVMEEEGDVDSPSISPESVTDMDNDNSNDTEGSQTEHPEPDFYWNFKCGEFFLDSLFAIATIYEKHGDGLGMMIQSKMLLPLLLGLRHTNYTASIHRYVTRILCECTPKEGLKVLHERFSNKEGKVGGNIFKDRRMEHRIRTLKTLIGNLGPNFDQDHVQLINKVVEIKEELFYKTRKSHGVGVRTGNHVARDDTADYLATLEFLSVNEAHLRKSGREFGEYDLPADPMLYFDRAPFFRWITGKNEEAAAILENRNKM